MKGEVEERREGGNREEGEGGRWEGKVLERKEGGMGILLSLHLCLAVRTQPG